METLNAVAIAVVIAIFIETSYLTIMKLRQRSLKVARGSILLDTSSIMDGRIIDVARSGIITAELIIPRSVVRELQLLADKADHDKRVRARKGLDNIRELQKLDSVSVVIVNDGLAANGVDERLLELAQKYDAAIATTDYNLNKVARVINVSVINVNELAQMLRAKFLPGETVEINLIQAGANREQAVGYLEDGTMVVVEDAKNLIGQTIKVEIVRSLQTEAGRMMFAKKVHAGDARQGGGKSANHVSGGKSNGNNTRSRKSKPSATSRVREKLTTTSGKIKAAPAFHSDQLKRSSADNNAGNGAHNGSQPQRRSTPRRSADAAEADMVRLANQ